MGFTFLSCSGGAEGARRSRNSWEQARLDPSRGLCVSPTVGQLYVRRWQMETICTKGVVQDGAQRTEFDLANFGVCGNQMSVKEQSEPGNPIYGNKKFLR